MLATGASTSPNTTTTAALLGAATAISKLSRTLVLDGEVAIYDQHEGEA